MAASGGHQVCCDCSPMLAIFDIHDFRTRVICLCFVVVSTLGLQAAKPATFEVRVVGSGPSVLLIPGLSCSGAIWDDTVKHLQDRYQCHILSIRGFGGTPMLRPMTSPFLPAIRDEIIDYARALGHPAIVGHSLGGVLAMAVAAKAPDVPSTLVIVDSAPFLAEGIGADPLDVDELASAIQKKIEGMSEEDFKAAQSLVIRTMVDSDHHAETLSALAARSDQSTVSRALGELMRTDLRPEMAVIKCPTLVILAGINMSALSDDARARLRGQFSSLPDARVLIFEKSRHFIMFDEPGKFFAELDQALSRP